MHLTKFLSLCGIASRRKCVEIIKDSQIRVNGALVLEPGFRLVRSDRVSLGGRELRLSEMEKVYVMLNKPRGYVCSSADRFSEKLAVNLIKIPEVRLFSAGRLDKESEGLIIFSNDGGYVATLTHPRHGISKKYEVLTDRALGKEDVAILLSGIRDDNETLKAANISNIGVGANRYLFIMKEGRKREIRRLVAHTGAKVLHLKRIGIGTLEIGDLKAGQWRFLDKNEIASSLERD